MNDLRDRLVLPNFLCVGAEKSGTTSLQDILIQHPDIFVPEAVEPHFFDFDDRYLKKGVEWYHTTYFSKWAGQSAVGEFTPAYMYLEKVPERIYETLGSEIKLLFSLRNPVDRAYSQYLMYRRNGFESDDFETANRKELAAARDRSPGYITRGLYSEQIERYLHYFPRENMLFLSFEEDFIQNRKTTLGRIQDFLGVRQVALNVDIKSNAASEPKSRILRDILHPKNAIYRAVGRAILPSHSIRRRFVRMLDIKNQRPLAKAELPEDFRVQLWERHFAQDVAKLETLIGRDFSHWKVTKGQPTSASLMSHSV